MFLFLSFFSFFSLASTGALGASLSLYSLTGASRVGEAGLLETLACLEDAVDEGSFRVVCGLDAGAAAADAAADADADVDVLVLDGCGVSRTS